VVPVSPLAGRRPAVARRASDEVLLAGVLQLRIERWLEQEGVFDAAGMMRARPPAARPGQRSGTPPA
jgi:hypothetical protein